MKKTVYMAPATKVTKIATSSMICSSITSVGGNAGITMGEGDAPTAADSRRSSVWGDDDEE